MFQEREYCRSCGHTYPAEELSNKGLCAHCGITRAYEAASQLQAHKGQIWEKWKRCYVAAMSGVLQRLSE